MPELIRDPELDRLIREMNEMDTRVSAAEPEEGDPQQLLSVLDEARLALVDSGEPLQRLLSVLTREGASDLLLICGSPPMLRCHGAMQALDAPPLEASDLKRMFAPHMGRRAHEQLALGAADFSLRLAAPEGSSSAGWRLRVNLHRQRGELAAAVRILPQKIPAFDELGLPPAVAALAQASHGLVLLSGPTGTGKTTTLASLVDLINRTSSRHVITIEDPIEYEHSNRRSVIEQIQLGTDTPSFATALRACLRCNPDIILVGEMRDTETMETAITAAETGHLIFSTLHTGDVAQAIHRIVDGFPSGQQPQIRQQLSLSLHAVVCQQLVPRAGGRGRVPAVEILIATHAIRNLIRKNTLHLLYNELVVGRQLGMIAMEESLAGLVKSGAISHEEAAARAPRPDELARVLAG